MTYNEALDYIWSTPSPSSERLSIFGRLLEELGNPHKGMKYVHIGGTNGKGSTSAMISSILRCAGYKTGLYTSPHLNTINERFQIDGRLISDEEFAEITTLVAEACERIVAQGHPRPTIFGLITAVGFVFFKRHKCDIVVLEVGMGGRLDATNAIESSEVTVITNIGLDHTEYLGGTIGQIAAEKAGIIKMEAMWSAIPRQAKPSRYRGRMQKAKRIHPICRREYATVRNTDLRGTVLILTVIRI